MAKSEPFLSLGLSAVDWIEHFIVHGPGDVQGQPQEYDDEFAAFVVKAYRLERLGSRVVRRGFLSRAKGRNKSGVGADLSCFEALGPCRFSHFAEPGEVSYWGYEYDPGEPVGKPLGYVEVLNVATEEGQAGNTYDGVYYKLHPDTCSPELLAEFGKIDVGLTRINMPDRRGFIQPVTSADTSADGAKSTFIVADETHLWLLPRLHRLHGVMTRNLLKRKVASGWMLETSTMYAEGEGSVAEGTHTYAKSKASSVRSLLFDHRQASMGWDLDKRRDRLAALAEAYGPAAAWMNLEAIADSWDDPQVSEGEFRRFWLNQPVPVQVVTSVLPSWRECAAPEVVPAPPTAFGLAVSFDGEWASIAAVSSDDTPYLGAVRRDPGTHWVVPELKRLTNEHGVSVAVDGKGPGAFLIPELKEAGVPVAEADLDEYVKACADLFTATTEHTVRQGDHPELNTAVAAAKKRYINDGRWVWGRRQSSGDISMLEAVTLAPVGAGRHKREFWGAMG